MEVAIAAIVGGVIGYFLCGRLGHDAKKGVPLPPAHQGSDLPNDPKQYPSEEWTPGVPDGDTSEIISEAGSPGGVDPGTTTFETDELIERDVGHLTMQQGADAIEATHGRDAMTPFAPRPSVSSLGAFAGAFPAAPADPGADPSETPIE